MSIKTNQIILTLVRMEKSLTYIALTYICGSPLGNELSTTLFIIIILMHITNLLFTLDIASYALLCVNTYAF